MSLFKFALLVLVTGASAAASTSSAVADTSSMDSSPTSTVDNSGEYSLTAEPAVITQAPCVQNCLSPLVLGDPSGCDDVTNNCACISAPDGAFSAIEDCIATVCTVTASMDAYTTAAQSLFSSYCDAHYNAVQLSSASSAEASSNLAAAASSTITGEATTEAASAGSSTGTGTTASGGSSSGSAASASKTGVAATPGAGGSILALGGILAVFAAI